MVLASGGWVQDKKAAATKSPDSSTKYF